MSCTVDPEHTSRHVESNGLLPYLDSSPSPLHPPLAQSAGRSPAFAYVFMAVVREEEAHGTLDRYPGATHFADGKRQHARDQL